MQRFFSTFGKETISKLNQLWQKKPENTIELEEWKKLQSYLGLQKNPALLLQLKEIENYIQLYTNEKEAFIQIEYLKLEKKNLAHFLRNFPCRQACATQLWSPNTINFYELESGAGVFSFANPNYTERQYYRSTDKENRNNDICFIRWDKSTAKVLDEQRVLKTFQRASLEQTLLFIKKIMDGEVQSISLKTANSNQAAHLPTPLDTIEKEMHAEQKDTPRPKLIRR